MKLALKKLRSKYHKQGYLTEDEVLDVSEDLKFSLKETEDLIGTLLEEGFIILEEEPEAALEFSAEDEIYDKSQIDYQEIFDEVVLLEPNLLDYINQIVNIRPPQKNEEFILIPKAKKGNIYAKERLIYMFLKVVVREALYFHKVKNFPLSDAIQEGTIGLIIAIDKYEIKPGHRFSTYAPLWIRQNMGRAYCNNGRTIRLPVHTLELLEEIKKIQSKYELKKNREPTIFEIIIEMSDLSQNIKEKILYSGNTDILLSAYGRTNFRIREEKIRHLLKISRPNLSLDELITLSNDNMVDKDVVDPQESAEFSCLREDIRQALSLLTDRDRQILELRYGLYDSEISTLEEIGKEFNLTRERIRQIESRALEKLHNSPYQDQLLDYL